MAKKTSHKLLITLGEIHRQYLDSRARKDAVSKAEVVRTLIEEAIAGSGAAAKDPFFEMGTKPFKPKRGK